MNYKLDIELSAELEPYRSAIAATIKPYIKIELTNNNKPTWWQSKFGGLPYLPKGFKYPKSDDGEYLYLLAQINFAEVPQLEGLPEEGILQFYLAADDEFYGCDFDEPFKQDKFRVVYFPDVDLEINNLVTDFSFLPKLESEDWLMPFQGCCQIKFSLDTSPISANDYQFDFFNPCNSNDEVDAKFEEYWDKFDSSGHKLLGYPYFTQNDPRDNLSEDEPYILLFQIDSDSNENGYEICWGDAGVGNFFIKRSQLNKLDFTEVIYNWDCG
ncbi:MAG: YwqG family protein [Pleurocapsa sp.]